MGDLMGMPVVVDGATTMAPPEWVPREEGPGILLIDDVNRADDRILRQLFQNYELAGWSLPRRWQIVMTANPDGGDYSVTPMDDAMLTRMLHVTLSFDVKRWAKWAEENGVDPRGIAFVLTYPEVVTGVRTTPRTLVQFFDRIQRITDLEAHLDLVTILGDACLDRATVSSFVAFVQQNLQDLISPDEILSGKGVQGRLKRLVAQDPPRVDILSAICTRLVNGIENRKKGLSETELEGLAGFMMAEGIPADMRLTLAQDLSSLPPRCKVGPLFGRPEVAHLLLA